MLLSCGVGEDSWESLGLQGDPSSPSERKSFLNIHWKGWYWSWSSNTFATWCKELTHWKRPGAGKDLRQEAKETTEDEMVGWHHWVDGHEFEQALVAGEGQGSQACCSPWGHRVGHDWVTELNHSCLFVFVFVMYNPESLLYQDIFPVIFILKGYIDDSVVKNPPANSGDCKFNPWFGIEDPWRGLQITWRRKWQTARVFLSVKSMDRGAWWSAIPGVSKSWIMTEGSTQRRTHIQFKIWSRQIKFSWCINCVQFWWWRGHQRKRIRNYESN